MITAAGNAGGYGTLNFKDFKIVDTGFDDGLCTHVLGGESDAEL